VKSFVVACAVIFLWATVAWTESVEVYDWSTGDYKEYDVRQRGRNVEVYDWEDGRYLDYTISPGRRELYDWQNSRYLDLKPKGDNRFEVYDWEENNYYDVKVKHR